MILTTKTEPRRSLRPSQYWWPVQGIRNSVSGGRDNPGRSITLQYRSEGGFPEAGRQSKVLSCGHEADILQGSHSNGRGR